LTECTVLVTGSSPGSIGEAAAVAIARSRPALLILASRTPSNLDEVASRIHSNQITENPTTSSSNGPDGSSVGAQTVVKTVVVDLASQASIREAATKIIALTDRIDVLIHNAGINVKNRQLSPEGIELMFSTNHLGPFLLTQLLLPLLLQSARLSPRGCTRVVNVSSSGHHISPMRFSDYNFEPGVLPPPEEQPQKGLSAWIYEETNGFPSNVAYGVSKCANILFTVGLKRRLLGHGIASFALDPGGTCPVML